MSESTGSLQSKKLRDVLSSKLRLRWYLFKRKYASGSGIKQLIVRIIMYLLIIGLAFVFLYPFLYMIINSLMSDADLNSSTVKWIPTEIKFANYPVAYTMMKIKYTLKNSVEVTLIATFGHIIVASFVGYGFARYHFPLKKVMFFLVILAFIVPIQTLIIPYYFTYFNFGWLNTFLPMTVPPYFGYGLKGALYVFLFRQFYLTVPKSLEEAARIDGCGFLKTYWKIVFPLAKSTIVVAMVLSVVWHWNDTYEPSLYINKSGHEFFPSRLKFIVDASNALPEEQQEILRSMGVAEGEDVLNNAVVLAGATIISAPILIFFAFAQKQFMQGIERSGITGE